jgi:hypothetical protein
MILTTRDRRELAKFLEDVKVHLNRCANPEAIRLLRRFFADENGTDQVARSEPENVVYLGGDDHHEISFELDIGGHRVVRLVGGLPNCLTCTRKLLLSGDLSATWARESYEPDEKHQAIQRFILNHPGTDFLTAARTLEADESGSNGGRS